MLRQVTWKVYVAREKKLNDLDLTLQRGKFVPCVCKESNNGQKLNVRDILKWKRIVSFEGEERI